MRTAQSDEGARCHPLRKVPETDAPERNLRKSPTAMSARKSHFWKLPEPLRLKHHRRFVDDCAPVSNILLILADHVRRILGNPPPAVQTVLALDKNSGKRILRFHPNPSTACRPHRKANH